MTDAEMKAAFTNGEKTISANIMAGGAKPEVVVKQGDNLTLTEGKDYTLAYKNNKAGAKKAPEVVITGKGNYTGKTTLNFTLQNKPINTKGITVAVNDREADTKKGKWVQSFKVFDEDGKALKAGVDYEKSAKYEQEILLADGSVSYKELNPKDKNVVLKEKAVIRVTVTGKGNYAGEGKEAATISTTYRLLEANHDLSKAKIVIAPQEYTGGAVTISANDFTTAETGKKNASVQLIERDKDGKITDVHFTIDATTYQKNDKKGTAKVTIRGKEEDGFGGEKVVTFKIQERTTDKNWWKDLMDKLFN